MNSKKLLLPALSLLASVPFVNAAESPFANSLNLLLQIFSFEWAMGANMASATRGLIWLAMFALCSGIFKMLSEGGVGGGVSFRWLEGRTAGILSFVIATVSAIFMPAEAILSVGVIYGSIGLIVLMAPVIAGVGYVAFKAENKIIKALGIIAIMYVLGWFATIFAKSAVHGAAGGPVALFFNQVVPVINVGLILYLLYIILGGNLNFGVGESVRSGLSSIGGTVGRGAGGAGQGGEGPGLFGRLRGAISGRREDRAARNEANTGASSADALLRLRTKEDEIRQLFSGFPAGNAGFGKEFADMMQNIQGAFASLRKDRSNDQDEISALDALKQGVAAGTFYKNVQAQFLSAVKSDASDRAAVSQQLKVARDKVGSLFSSFNALERQTNTIEKLIGKVGAGGARDLSIAVAARGKSFKDVKDELNKLKQGLNGILSDSNKVIGYYDEISTAFNNIRAPANSRALTADEKKSLAKAIDSIEAKIVKAHTTPADNDSVGLNSLAALVRDKCVAIKQLSERIFNLVAQLERGTAVAFSGGPTQPAARRQRALLPPPSNP